MNEKIEAIKSSILDSLDKAKTALNNKEVSVETLKVSEIPDYIRQIELNKIKLTVNCSEFESGTIKATKDGTERTGTVKDGQCIIMLPSTGTWHVEHDLGDYVETEVNGDTSAELVKKKVTFSEGDCSEEKIIIHVDSVVGNNSNDNFIRVKKNGVIIEVQAQLIGSDIEITNFEYEDGATYTIEYVIKDEVRGSIEVKVSSIGESTELEEAFLCPEDIDEKSITKIIFTDEIAPKGVKVYDKSKAKDHGVVVWEKDNTLYCSTQKTGMGVKAFNSNFNYLDFSLNSLFVCETLAGKKAFDNLIELDLNNIDTSLVSDFDSYFRGLKQLKTIKNIDKMSIESATSLYRMFMNCEALQSIDLSSWNLQNEVNCNNLLSYCIALENVNLSNFNPKNSSSFSSMFEHCSQLKTIDISSWAMTGKISASSMFNNCAQLKTIYSPEWKATEMYDNDMFTNCTSLPNYNPSNVRIQMAKWKENGGYFTNPAEKDS